MEQLRISEGCSGPYPGKLPCGIIRVLFYNYLDFTVQSPRAMLQTPHPMLTSTSHTGADLADLVGVRFLHTLPSKIPCC